nr:chloroplast sensor kinase, chloroplastic [Tanacetum cinerariifolium]
NVITKKCKCRFEENRDFNQNEGKTGAGRWRGFCVGEKVGNEVYVRPSGSYVMDILELRRVTIYLGRNVADILIVISNFIIPTGIPRPPPVKRPAAKSGQTNLLSK